jgi:hypothetical protein
LTAASLEQIAEKNTLSQPDRAKLEASIRSSSEPNTPELEKYLDSSHAARKW